jgi:hypothetical protein
MREVCAVCSEGIRLQRMVRCQLLLVTVEKVVAKLQRDLGGYFIHPSSLVDSSAVASSGSSPKTKMVRFRWWKQDSGLLLEFANDDTEARGMWSNLVPPN